MRTVLLGQQGKKDYSRREERRMKKKNFFTPIACLLAILCLISTFANIGERYVLKASRDIKGFSLIFGNYDISEYTAIYEPVGTWLSLIRLSVIFTLIIIVIIGIMTAIKNNRLTNVLAAIGATVNVVMLIIDPYLIRLIGEGQNDKTTGIVTLGIGEVGYFLYVLANILIFFISFILIIGEKNSYADTTFSIINTIILGLFVVITLYPILNTLAVSVNDGLDALRGGIYLWPRKFTWENYTTVFSKESLVQASIVTVARTVLSTVLHLFTTALLAYVLTRNEFLFSKQISILYVLTMYVNGGMIPTYMLYKNLGLTNNFWVYVLPGMVSAFNMIVIRTYMNGLPNSLVESAQVDGAGHLRIFFRIILPLCKPVLATVALFIAVYQWNAWFDAMLFNQLRADLTTLQYELMKLLSSVTNQGANANSMEHAASMVTPTSVRAATTIVTSLPIVMLYPFLQRYFVTGLTIGGVKE